MNELNLDRLNLTSPYTLWRTENNSYGFRTNYGVIYRVGFYKNELIWADNSYEFGKTTRIIKLHLMPTK